MTSEPQPNLGYGEVVPRYVLIEDLVRDRRVLELGTVDPEALVRLAAAGAARVVATCERPERFDAASLKTRRIELLAHTGGRLPFEDAAFDVVLVPDLLTELAASPEHLGELRRVLSPDGFALLGFEAAGRRLADLFGAREPATLRGDPRRVSEAVRKVFGRAKLFRQTPFVGMAFLAEGSKVGGELSLDTTLSGAEAEPSHVMALVGKVDVLADERTLVELPQAALEAMSLAGDRARLAELARLERRVEQAELEIDRRDASLKAIGARLPELESAIAARSEGAPEELRRELEQLRAERAELLARAAALEAGVDADGGEVEALRRQLRELESAREREQRRGDALEAELETLGRDRVQLGAEVREAEARAAQLARRLEAQGLDRAKEGHQLMARAAALADALAESEQAREAARDRSERLERALGEAESRVREAEQRAELVARRAEAERERHADGEDARRDAFEARSEAEQLRRQLADRERQLASLRDELRLGGHATQAQLESLRARVQELRNERDTLARASQLLIEERDAAAALGRQVIDADQRVKALAHELESRTAALARAEAERDAAEHARAGFEATLRDLSEVSKRSEGATAAALGRAEAAERERDLLRARVQHLDQQLAKLHAELSGRDALSSDAERRLPELEELLQEATQALRAAQRDNQAWRERAAGLERGRVEAEDQANAVLAARARAEAQLTEVTQEKIALTGELGRARAELAMFGARVAAAEAAWRKALGERDALKAQLGGPGAARPAPEEPAAKAGDGSAAELERVREELERARAEAARERKEREHAALGLGKTLEQAAEMAKQLKQLEREAKLSRERAVELEQLRAELAQARSAAEAAAPEPSWHGWRQADALESALHRRVMPRDVAERAVLREALEHEAWRREQLEHNLLRARRELEEIVARSTVALEAARARIVGLEAENAALLRERELLRGDVERRLGELRAALDPDR